MPLASYFFELLLENFKLHMTHIIYLLGSTDKE